MTRRHHADTFLDEQGRVVVILPKSVDLALLDAFHVNVQYHHKYITRDHRTAFVLTDPRNSVTLEPTASGAKVTMRVTNNCEDER